MAVDIRRTRLRNNAPVANGPVVYWMQRDQRIDDNWALLYAQEVALARGVPLLVLFNLVPVFGKATLRHYHFMFAGLRDVEARCRALAIPFFITTGTPTEQVIAFVTAQGAGEVVTDFNPLRFTDDWRAEVGKQLSVRLTEVDAHNIVPSWQASGKEEFAAYTFRPKVHRLLSEYLTAFPVVQKMDSSNTLPVAATPIDWEQLLATQPIDQSVAAVEWLVPGATAAHDTLRVFCGERLARYAEKRNDPNEAAQSNLSPYLHFGQIAAQRVALVVRDADAPRQSRDAFLEELIVRRELADNFCFYNRRYDRLEGAHAWAQETLRAHEQDTREYVYTLEQLDRGETHDPLWNAMQRQLTSEGKMHGWARMYWAKKILEWSPTVQVAIDNALHLNDRYELDGNDPNGVTGVMWSICGVHDRAWTERPVFGKIRYMNFAGAKRKFDVARYIARYSNTLFS